MTILLLLCFTTFVVGLTKNSNGNPIGEIGSPAFDEIVVHSTLNVKTKVNSRGAKALTNESKPAMMESKRIPLLNANNTQSAANNDGSVLMLKRIKRAPRRNYYSEHGGFPGVSSSSSQASSNAFNQNTPFGSFGASASQASSQSQSFGPYGLQAAAGQSSSQTYRLPNGNQIDVSFSSGYSTGGKGGPSFSGGHSVTITNANGQKYQVAGRRR